jgi:hypothetical protein
MRRGIVMKMKNIRISIKGKVKMWRRCKKIIRKKKEFLKIKKELMCKYGKEKIKVGKEEMIRMM